MEPSPRKVASRFLDAAQEFRPEWYGLEGLFNGKPVKLYHGSTRLFQRFSLSRSRDELNDKFYGNGIFLVPKKTVAGQYADANRNIGFDPSIIDDLKRVNRGAGAFLQDIYKRGLKKAWARVYDAEDPAAAWEQLEKELGGADPNTLGDIAEYIIGSAVKPGQADDMEEVMAIFTGGGSTGTPSHVYDSLDEVGLDSFKYRPKVYTVQVRVSNPLVTASQSEARKARSKGYDCVIYHGRDLVDNVPEVAVYDPSKVKIVKVEEW